MVAPGDSIVPGLVRPDTTESPALSLVRRYEMHAVVTLELPSPRVWGLANKMNSLVRVSRRVEAVRCRADNIFYIYYDVGRHPHYSIGFGERT